MNSTVEERPSANYWCITHDCPDGKCGQITSHYVVALDHEGPPTSAERKGVLIRRRARLGKGL